MYNRRSYITFFKVVSFVTIALIGISGLQAQSSRKPRQLREEMLREQKKNTPKKEPIERTPRKYKTKQPPQVGATVLKPANPLADKRATLVYLQHSDRLMFDQSMHPGIQILVGNVRFRHDDALLYCDSAHFDDSANTFDAYGRIRIVQGDTLTAYGDFLNYDGNTKMARLWGDNVRMENRNTVLNTDMLYYDRGINLAYYETGGVINDGNTTLTSIWGQYSPTTKVALFKDQVKMKSPDAVMTTDTLKYRTNTSVADIVGNSLIVYKEETDIYSQRGWYDTKSDRMMLLDRSLVEQNDGKTLVGDTIFYDKKKKYGEAFSKVELNDPKQKATLLGNYVSYDEEKSLGLASDSALFVDWSGKDSLFLSADTLYMMKDSIETDTIAYNKLQAYMNVRFYRSDVQGMCDSLLYNSRDSIMYLRGLPVMWSDNNQIMGKRMTAFTKNQAIDYVKIEQSAVAIQKDSMMYYNQLSGKEMTAYLDSGQLSKVYVSGNAETIYFPKDEKTGDYIGINKTLSSYVTMYFKEKKIDRIVLTTASSGVMYPLDDMEENDLYLQNFYWYDKERPLKVDDLYVKYERTPPPKREESTKRPSFPGGGAEGDARPPGGTASPTDSSASAGNAFAPRQSGSGTQNQSRGLRGLTPRIR